MSVNVLLEKTRPGAGAKCAKFLLMLLFDVGGTLLSSQSLLFSCYLCYLSRINKGILIFIGTSCGSYNFLLEIGDDF